MPELNILFSTLQAGASLKSSTRQVHPQPLPDSTFIMSNIPSSRPVPPTTATKAKKTTKTKKTGTLEAKKKISKPKRKA
jgi:hypothetical protein